MRITIELRRPARRSVALLVAVVLLAVPAVVLAGHQFSDVPNSNPFHSDIDAIADAGISGGFSDGGFHPTDAVTRQAMAAFLHRGLGRVGLSANVTPMTTQIDVAATVNSTPSFVPVRQLTITVPGAANDFAPQQLVFLHGHVVLNTAMTNNVTIGCPCDFAATIRDMASGQQSFIQREAFESGSTNQYPHALDVEGLFLATPGARTFQLEVKLQWRENDDGAVSFYLDSSSSLSAMTFPFGPTGGNSL